MTDGETAGLLLLLFFIGFYIGFWLYDHSGFGTRGPTKRFKY